MVVLKPKIYVQYGMKRSGNHAVSGWLVPKIRAKYYNNILPARKFPIEDKNFPPLDNFFDWRAKYNEGRASRLRHIPLVRRICFTRNMYLTLEDLPLSLRAFAPHAPQDILVLRSFDNMMASRIRKGFRSEIGSFPQTMNDRLRQIIDTWKEHARIFLKEEVGREDRVAIYFDEWLVNREYRAAICERLKLSPGDDGLERVSEFGGGSSFDGKSYDGSAARMDLLKRSEQLQARECALFEETLADGEVTGLIDRIAACRPIELI